MDVSLVSVLCVAAAFALGLGFGFLLARHLRPAGAEGNEALARARISEAAATARAERLEQENNGLIERARSDSTLMRTLTPIAQQLEQMSRGVQNLENSQSAQQAKLSEQLETATRTQITLSRETSSLRAALTSTSARGMWGEVELRRVVEAAGMLPHVDFTEQATQRPSAARSLPSQASQRPDLVINLPAGARLAVDAKVPLNAMLEAQAIETTSAEAREKKKSLLSEHARAVRAHIKALGKRAYHANYPNSPQFTIMFLPSDSLLSEALNQDPTLLEDSYALGVAPVGPSSLLALLRATAAVWASAQVTEEAQEIAALGRELVSRLSTVASHLDSLGSSLARSVDHYNSAVASLVSRVLVTARRFQSLDTPVSRARAVEDDSAQIRRFTQAEFREPEPGKDDKTGW